MKTLPRLTFFLSLFCLVYLSPSLIFSAAFSLPSSLINIPVADTFRSGDLDFGISVGYNSTEAYEYDYKLYYAPSDKLKIGVTLLNYHQLVGSFHVTFFQIPKLWNLRLGGGLLYITSDKTLSTWEEYNANKANNFSNYLVGSMDTPWGKYHLGFGKKRFESSNTSDTLGGIFFGTEYPLTYGKVMAEYDGTDFNAGFQLPIGGDAEVAIAGTQLTRTTDADENTPKEYGSVGVTLHHNFSAQNKNFEIAKDTTSPQTDQLKKTNAALQKQIKELTLAYADLQEKSAQNTPIVSQSPAATPVVVIPSVSQEQQLEALGYFNTAQEEMAKDNFSAAIKSLTKAIDTDPTVSDFYLQRGYLLYRKGKLNKKDPDWELVQQFLLKKAQENWDKVKELNPRDPALSRLPQI